MPGQTRIVTRSRDGEAIIYPTNEVLALNIDSLLAAWTFGAQANETVHNDAAADFDGVRKNNPQWHWSRTAGPAIRGDGGERYVQLSTHDDYTGDVTFAALVKPHAEQTALIGARRSPYLALGMRNAQVEVALGDQQVETSDSGLGLPQVDEWQLIAVRGNGSSGEWVHIYQGTVTTGSFTYSWPTSGNYDMRLLNADGSGHYLDGDQGLTVLYERHLGDTELASIYQMTTGLYQ